MIEFEISVEDVSALSAALPGLRGSIYAGDKLLVPETAASEITAMVADLPAYRAAAFVALKTSLKRQVDVAAEAERLKYITGGAGQAMTYQRKVEEARVASTDSNPDPGDYPLLAASVGIDGPDIATVAGVILDMDAAWAHIGAAIEAVRLGSKKAIDETESQAAAQMAFDVVEWPAP